MASRRTYGDRWFVFRERGRRESASYTEVQADMLPCTIECDEATILPFWQRSSSCLLSDGLRSEQEEDHEKAHPAGRDAWSSIDLRSGSALVAMVAGKDRGFVRR